MTIWVCEDCGAEFEAPEYETVCAEELYGVSSQFGNYNYIDIATCPDCGSQAIEEDWREEDEYDD